MARIGGPAKEHVSHPADCTISTVSKRQAYVMETAAFHVFVAALVVWQVTCVAFVIRAESNMARAVESLDAAAPPDPWPE